MRRGELLGVEWPDIDTERRTLTVTRAKNGDPRTIPLSRKAVDILSALKRTDAKQRIFPMSANAVKLAWKRIAQRAQLDDLHLHDLRHEAISRFFEKGLNIAEVALISGHKDPRMLFRYTHLRAEELAKKL
jgi:integrase